jgi:hypothetical protein
MREGPIKVTSMSSAATRTPRFLDGDHVWRTRRGQSMITVPGAMSG